MGLFFLAAYPVLAQEGVTYKRDLPAVRIDTPPVIDGDLSDPVWQTAAKAESFTDGLTGQAAPDQTVAFTAFDDKKIYVAFHAYDSRPKEIVARETKRGSRFQSEDNLAFSVDLYHTHNFNDRSFFMVNPLGTQFAQLSGGRGTKLEWEGAWQSAAKIVEDGWTAELAIPWEILNYPSVNGPTVCGVNFDRYQQRTQIHSWWSNLGSPERDELDGVWRGIHFPRYRPRLSLLPYASPEYAGSGSPELHSGLDLRYTMTPSLTLVGTVNPDFRNVEGAVEGIDFSYGERFVEDRRPFFQEGSNIYGIGMNGADFFYTGRIPAFDTGLKLYGKLNKKDTIGVLSAVNFGSRADWIMRGRHEFGTNNFSDVALINRDGDRFDDDGNSFHGSNRVAVLKHSYTKKLWSSSLTYADSWSDGRPRGGAGTFRVSYATSRWYAQVNPRFVRPNFTDDLGFVPFKGFKGLGGYGSYFREWRKGPLKFFNVESDFDNDRHTDGSVFRRRGSLFTFVQTRNDWGIGLGWNGGRFDEFNDSVYSVNLSARNNDPFHRYGIRYSWGREGGEQTTLLSPYVTWRFGKKLTLGLSSQILNREGSQHQHVFTFNHDFSPSRGIGGRIIARNGGTGGYFSFRNSGYGGMETFLILGDPNAAKFRKRVVLKTVWALRG